MDKLAKYLCWPCIALIVIIGIFDLVCTIYVHRGGLLIEQNPVALYALQTYNEVGLITLKLASIVIACSAILLAYRLGYHAGTLVVGMVIVIAIQVMLAIYLLLLLFNLLM
jgi:hypothetical protein